MIELVDIKKSYEYPILNNINYTFEEGKIYVIKGVSGCGKSTLLHILSSFDEDYEGSVTIDGKPLKEFNKKEREDFRNHIGYLFQSSLLLSKLTVKENLLFIKEDEKKIVYLAEQLGVSDLLDRYPKELSGGQRQRIALIRAMLYEPNIMIADEPTASLDSDNSKNIATLFREMAGENRIIIIATHEDCFDEIADEIILLHYGTIESVIENTKKQNAVQTSCISFDESVEDKKYKKRNFWKFVYKRNRERYSWSKLFPSMIIIFFLLMSLSIQCNIQTWYIDSILKDYPYTMFSLSNEVYKDLKNVYDLKVYENYTYPSKNAGVYPLFEKEDSGIAYGNVMEYGEFPEKENEIVVSKPYIESEFKTKEYSNVIGKKVYLDNNEFLIVGILSDLQGEKENTLFYSNRYYQDVNAKSIFIPYETIKRIGTLKKTPYKMVKMNSLYENKEYYETIRMYVDGPITEWDHELLEIQYLVDTVFYIILITVGVLAFISILFIKNEVQLELYYRRKEIGFLQLFGLRKTKIRNMILFERSFGIIIPLAFDIGIYMLVSIMIPIISGYHITIPILNFIVIIVAIILYAVIVTWIPCRKILKKNVIELIK